MSNIKVPLPDPLEGVVVAEPPGDGPGYWSGAPTAILVDGTFWLTYRVRLPIGVGRGVATVVARSNDGEFFEDVLSIDKTEFGAESFERPAILRKSDGTWQLYLSCATPGSKHWWIDVIEASDPSEFRAENRRTVFAGDEQFAMKDPIVKYINGRYYAWICMHPLDIPGTEDRMTTRLAISDDTYKWEWTDDILTPTADTWDQRGTRLADVLLNEDGSALVYYDGRASMEENCEERTGLAHGPLEGPYLAEPDGPVAEMRGHYPGLRYLSVVPLPDGGYRLYYEASRPDGSHDLRSQQVNRP